MWKRINQDILKIFLSLFLVIVVGGVLNAIPLIFIDLFIYEGWKGPFFAGVQGWASGAITSTLLSAIGNDEHARFTMVFGLSLYSLMALAVIGGVLFIDGEVGGSHFWIAASCLAFLSGWAFPTRMTIRT